MRLVAWLGGFAFVASLGYLVYFYTFVLDSSAGDPPGPVPNLLFDAALFSVFAVHHSLFARSRVKALIVRLVPATAERSVYVWVSSLLFILVCAVWRLVPGMVYQVGGIWRIMLYGLQGFGLLLTIRGAGVIDPLELAGIRQASAKRSTDNLRIVGPFRIVRHPIYLGWMLIVFATPTMTVNRLWFATISSLYLILAIPWEERSLVAAHGDQYRAYQRTVRWRVLPGIW